MYLSNSILSPTNDTKSTKWDPLLINAFTYEK